MARARALRLERSGHIQVSEKGPMGLELSGPREVRADRPTRPSEGKGIWATHRPSWEQSCVCLHLVNEPMGVNLGILDLAAFAQGPAILWYPPVESPVGVPMPQGCG